MRAVVAAWMVAFLLGMSGLARAQGAPEPEFVYRFGPRDTLIQVCRRLLVEPRRWPQVQARNGIRDPFNIRPDTPVRIPYSWLKLVDESATVEAVVGTVTHAGAPVAPGDVLPPGARIETGTDGSVSLRFADRSVVTLQKSSVLRLERLQRVEGVRDGHSVNLRLDSGRAESAVQPKRDVGRFEIVTPVAVSAVRGTKFRSSFDASGGNSTAETLEGTVGVAGSQGSAAVGAGFGTKVEASGAVLAPVALLPMPDLSAIPATNAQPHLRVQFPAVPRASAYRAQLAADAEFHAPLLDVVAATPDLDLAISQDGGYWLRARAIDEHGIEGTDAIRQFTQHVLPAAPALLAPAADARLNAGTATAQWAGVPQAGRYHFQLARDAQFADLLADRAIAGATQADLGALAAGTYYWRVASVNAHEEPGAWSDARRFVQRAAAPHIEAVRVDRHELHLTWPSQPGMRYHLQLARNPGFAQPVVDETLSTNEYLLAKPHSGAYYARLQVLPANGDADPFGETKRFDISLATWVKVLLGCTVLIPVLL